MGLKSKHNEATSLVQQMTLEEKASLMSGKSFWFLQGNERLGLDPVMVTDGPHGLRKQAAGADHVGLNKSVPATCFPTASALAGTWNPALLEEIGVALGEQCVAESVAVLLGPGVNIKRHPLCGRNFEYFSEDPLLAGVLATAMISGVQSQGVGTSIKHFAVNNQEFGRMFIDAIVDERTLREIYLPAFELAVKQAQPWTVMCAYNRVNGEFCGEHDWLLNQVLREEWGFEGLVVSDWGATNERVAGVRHGLDLEMPGGGKDNDRKVAAAIRDGSLKETELDVVATRVASLSLLGADVAQAQRSTPLDQVAHHALARRAATEGAVLLKNDGAVLPVDATADFCVIGAFAKHPRYQGTGSSQVNPTTLENAYDALLEQSGQQALAYAAGYDPDTDDRDDALIAAAAALAAEHDIAFVFAGLPTIYESEGFDRTHMRMPEQHIALIEAVGRANPNTVVLLANGAPVEMPWIESVPAVLETYLAGQAGGGAIADLLFGALSPSGKLAETFPLHLEDVPSNTWFPGGEGRQVQYREGLYVGYRYFGSFDVPVLFPFGHGLSYTQFEYDDLRTDANWSAEAPLTVRLSVTNRGDRTGSEVVQVYMRAVEANVYRPDIQLAGFAKIALQPGEIGEVEVQISPRAASYYDTAGQAWQKIFGTHEIMVGASSTDIRARCQVTIKGTVPNAARTEGPSFTDSSLAVSDNVFAAMLGRAVPAPESVRPFHRNSTLGEIAEVRIGRWFKDRAMAQFLKGFGGLEDPTLKHMFEEMARSMPLRALSLFSGKDGLTAQHIDALVALLNGHYTEALKLGWAIFRSR